MFSKDIVVGDFLYHIASYNIAYFQIVSCCMTIFGLHWFLQCYVLTHHIILYQSSLYCSLSWHIALIESCCWVSHLSLSCRMIAIRASMKNRRLPAAAHQLQVGAVTLWIGVGVFLSAKALLRVNVAVERNHSQGFGLDWHNVLFFFSLLFLPRKAQRSDVAVAAERRQN